MTRRGPGDRRGFAALLLLACLLGAGLVALHRGYPDLMVRRLATGDEGSAPAQTPAGPANGDRPATGQPNSPPPPESRFAVIALRPLFSPGRRPLGQPEVTADAGPAGAAPPDLLVTGIVMADADSVAILEPARPGPQAELALVVRAGDSVRGWTVEAIEPGLVVLTRDGARHEMPLIDEDDPRRPKAAPRRNPASGANSLRPTQPPQPMPQPPLPMPQPQPPAAKP